MSDKALVLTMDDINKAYDLVFNMAETKYGDEVEQVVNRIIVNTPAVQKLAQELVKELHNMIADGMDPEKIKELCEDCDVDDHLYESLFGEGRQL